MTDMTTITRPDRKAVRAEPNIKSMLEVSFRCSDPAETRRYFEDFLGLELAAVIPTEVERDNKKYPALHMLFRMAGGNFIGAYHVPGDPHPTSYAKLGPMGFHIGTIVSSNEDFITWQERLKQAEIGFMGPLDHGFQHSVYFEGPDNIWLEIAYCMSDHEDRIAAEAAASGQRLSEWALKTAKQPKLVSLTEA